MKKLYVGIILIMMMLGHNYVINQPQSLQKQIEQIHNVHVTQFNLLYSIPSILALLTIVPVGLLYHSYPNFTLLFGVSVIFFGQLLVSMFGSEGKQGYFTMLVAGRTFQASGAEVLYMIQGNLASSWMSNYAGLIFILPQVGQIMNAFFTPYAAIHWGVKTSLWLGVIFCSISAVACCYLYFHLKSIQKVKGQIKVQMVDHNESKLNSIQIEPKISDSNHTALSDQQSSREKGFEASKISSELINQSGQNEQKDKSSDEQLNSNKKARIPEPETIFKAGKIFWLTILICAINQCLYFPFLDNANQLIQMRFKIPYDETGFFLCLPFVAAIITTLIMSKVLPNFERKNLIFYTSVLPFLGHLIILSLPNCEEETLSTGKRFILGSGFFVFGSGIGVYYSVSFPAVGMAVPQKIRGLSYGVLCFFQTLAMSMIPMFSGLIIEEDMTNQTQGYRNSSFMFVLMTLTGVVVAYLIKRLGNETSYYYDDEAQLVEEQDSSDLNMKSLQIKSQAKQNKQSSNIKVQKIRQYSS